MATANQKNLVSSNAEYVKKFDQGHLALPPSKQYAVVTCMDARIDPVAAFGIPLGSAHIIRNAGGVAREALRSLIISEQLLGTKEIFVIKHTGCGMLTFKNEDARGIVKKNLGDEAAREVSGLDFQPFPSLEESAKSDVAFLKSQKAIPDTITITGWIYECETGKTIQVV